MVNPTQPTPSIPRNLALGTVLGLVAGAGAGWLRDRMDHIYHHAGEVKEELAEPLLGHIPHVDFFTGVREDKRFLLQELDKSVISDGNDTDAAKQRHTNASFIKRHSVICSPRSASSTATSHYGQLP